MICQWDIYIKSRVWPLQICRIFNTGLFHLISQKNRMSTQSTPAPLAKWNPLGNSGLKINNNIIGCMQYGSSQWVPWIEENEDPVFEILKAAYDKGLRTYDTADVYSNGESQRLLGKFLKK